MNKILSALPLLCVVVSSIKADSSPTTQVNSDIPQTSYVPSATTFQNSDISILNNQAYDPTLYSSFVPQDAVQQYVSQYGTGFSGQALEGFLIPALKQTEIAPLATPTFVKILKSFLPGPKIVLAILAKLVALAASAVGIIFFGGAITSFVCAFTPLCQITFIGSPLGALLRKDIVTEITADRIKRASDLLKLAYDKYQQMQNA